MCEYQRAYTFEGRPSSRRDLPAHKPRTFAFPVIVRRFFRTSPSRSECGLTVFLRRRSKCNGQLSPREALISPPSSRAAWFQRQKTGAKRRAAVFSQPVLEHRELARISARAAGPSGAAAGSCHFETPRQWNKVQSFCYGHK